MTLQPAADPTPTPEMPPAANSLIPRVSLVAGWHCTAAENLGVGSTPEYCHGPGWAAWWAPPPQHIGRADPRTGLAGMVALGSFELSGLPSAQAVWRHLEQNARVAFRALCDLRRAPTWLLELWPTLAPGPTIHLPGHSDPGAAATDRVDQPWSHLTGRAFLVPNDWTRHYWVGLAQGKPPVAIEAWWQVDSGPAGLWQGTRPDTDSSSETERPATNHEKQFTQPFGASAVEHGLETLLQHLHTSTELSRAALRLLLTDVNLGLSEAARRLGTSPRVLQRTLEAEGTTFSAMCDTVRLALAEQLLAGRFTTAAVAQHTGFSSASHLGVWLQKHQTNPAPAGRTTRFEDAAPVPPALSEADASLARQPVAAAAFSMPSTTTAGMTTRPRPATSRSAQDAVLAGRVPTRRGPDSLAKGPVPVAGWTWVAEDDLGLVPGRTVCRVTNALYVYARTPADPNLPVLAGNFCAGSMSASQARLSMGSWTTIQRNIKRPFRVAADVARTFALMVDEPRHWFTQIQKNVDQMKASFSPKLELLAFRATTNWTATWARGLLEWEGCPIHLCADRAEMFEWVAATGDEVAEVSELFEALEAKSATTFAIEQLLAQNPSQNLPQVAAQLGRSARSIQRALAEDSRRFEEVRDAMRLGPAERGLAAGNKVEAVATSVGFASVSHFRRWYRSHCDDGPAR